MSASLKCLNTFAIDVFAHRVVTAHTEKELLSHWQHALKEDRPILLLGAGSNVIFLDNFAGVVLLNRIKGITLREDLDTWYLHVGAGEIWHDLVTYSIDQNMPGLENLALIPGYVGSAPIQNIGAYGVELRQVCEYVDILLLVDGERRRISADECQFAYRESIFKHQRGNCAIVAVGLKLKKAWKPILSYGELAHFDVNSITPYQIFDAVCAVRCSKLPDPAHIGNAGSFFKNPVIDAASSDQLLKFYPNAPHYTQPDGKVKLAAAWLIDRCQLKGYKIGGASVHDKQALVLINNGQATGSDIAELAKYVRQKVADKFGIWLEPEVCFIGTYGEIDVVNHETFHTILYFRSFLNFVL